MAAQPSVFTAGAAPAPQALAAAHARLLRDKSLQFQFSAFQPPKDIHTPEWLKWLGRTVGGIANFIGQSLGWLFWAGLALALGLVLFFIVREIARSRWPDLFKKRAKKAKPREAPLDWRPDPGMARALLEEADRLAAAGDYAGAAHLLLYRSIQDIEGRRPRLVRPALTTRDIAGHADVPPPARHAFAGIAEVVEKSFFGGRAVDADAFAACRRSYEAFAFPEAWA